MKEPRNKWTVRDRCTFAITLIVILLLFAVIVSIVPSNMSRTGLHNAPKTRTCSQLKQAYNYIDGVEYSMIEQYGEAYLEDEFWTSFVSGFWGGFWAQHSECEICLENGDVPQYFMNR